jgi:hypothetical protein
MIWLIGARCKCSNTFSRSVLIVPTTFLDYDFVAPHLEHRIIVIKVAFG